MYAHRNYVSSSEEEDESTPIMTGNPGFVADSYLKDQIFRAVHSLDHLVIISFWTAIIVMSIFVAYAYQGYRYQLYMLFIALWLGHILFFVQLYRTYSRIQESLLPTTTSAADVDKPKYFTVSEDIEELIPLSLFVVHNITWIFNSALLVLISEIIFFFHFINMAPVYGGFVPLYILTGLTMSTHILCRSANIFSILSLLLVTSGIILVNIKMLNDSSMDWVEALAPFNLLALGWLMIMNYVLFCHVFQYYRLQVSQVISVFLYISSFVGYLISINFLTAYLLDTPGALDYELIVTLISFIISTILLFISVWVDVRHYLGTIVTRMGNELPVALKRVHLRDGSGMDDGVVGYDADPARAVRCFVLLGEIELASAGESRNEVFNDDPDVLQRSFFESFFTSCCSSTIEMLLYTKSKRKRRSGSSNGSSGGVGTSSGSHDRYGSDSSTSLPVGRGGAGLAAARRDLTMSDDSLDEGDEEAGYDRQKQRQYRQQQQQQQVIQKNQQQKQQQRRQIDLSTSSEDSLMYRDRD